MLAQDRGRLRRPDPLRARDPIRGVAAERDEVRHLLGLDAVPLPHLVGPDAVELADAALRQQDRRRLRRELEEVAVARHDERVARPGWSPPTAPRREEVVRLVSRPPSRHRSRMRRRARGGGRAAHRARAGSRARPGTGEGARAGRSGSRACRSREDRPRPLRVPEPRGACSRSRRACSPAGPRRRGSTSGRAWNARCASESPSTAISGRVAHVPACRTSASRRLIAARVARFAVRPAPKESRPGSRSASVDGRRRSARAAGPDARAGPCRGSQPARAARPPRGRCAPFPCAGAADASFAAPSRAGFPPGTSPSRLPRARCARRSRTPRRHPRRGARGTTRRAASSVRRPGFQSSDFAMKWSCRWAECAAERPRIEVGRVVCGDARGPRSVGTCSHPADAETCRDVLDDRKRDPMTTGRSRGVSVRAMRGSMRPLTAVAMVFRGGKTLVIAEKPSVGRDIAAALPGSFAKQRGLPRVGRLRRHLGGRPPRRPRRARGLRRAAQEVALRRPADRADEVQADARTTTSRRSSSRSCTSSCGATTSSRSSTRATPGREGELIFAYIFETAKVDKPVERLWLNSMTKACDPATAFDHLRPEARWGCSRKRPARAPRPTGS